MARKLKEIDVDEISLVGVAANRKKFYITKRSKHMDEEFVEILKGWFGEEFNDEAQAKLEKAMPEETAKIIQDAVGALDKYKDEYPDDVENAIKVLLKYAVYGYQTNKSDDEKLDMEKIVEAIEKAGKKLSKATREQIQKLKGIIDKLLEADADETKKQFGNLPADVVEKLKELEDIKKADAEKARKEAEDKEKNRDDKIDALQKEIDALKKGKASKKSVDGQGDDDDDKKKDEDEILFPSMMSHVGNEEE